MCDNRLKRKLGNFPGRNAAVKMNRDRDLAAMQRQSRQSPAASSTQDNTGDMEMEEMRDHTPGHTDVAELTELATSWYKHLSSGGLSNEELVAKCRFEAFVLDTDVLLQKRRPVMEFEDDGDETTQSQARQQQWSEFTCAMSRLESNMRVQYGEVRNSPTYLLWKRPELFHDRLRLLHFDKDKVSDV
jgi:hypothetical protein